MLSDKTVYELKTICMLYDVAYPKTSKKADLIEALEKAGITEEQYEADHGFKEEYVEALMPEIKEVVVKEETTAETKKKENILLKMIHPRGALNVGNGVIFTFDEPFKVLSEDQAQDILRRAKNEVREATPEEAAVFYGVSI